LNIASTARSCATCCPPFCFIFSKTIQAVEKVNTV
jgi:hypothetical protein